MKTILVVLLTALLAGCICPPGGWSGAWPPWCEQPETRGPFEYGELDYITQTFPPTNKNLLIGVGTMDMWGNPHVLGSNSLLSIDMGEDTRKNMASTMQRAGTIGSEALYFTDFIIYDKNLTLKRATETNAAGAFSPSQQELNNIMSTARTNNMNTLFMITNLYDPEFVYAKWLGTDLSDTASVKFREGGEHVLETTFPQWKNMILEQAERAENAGVDYLVINPGDTSYAIIYEPRTMSPKYSEIIPEIRQRFSGKIGLIGGISWMGDNELEVIKEVDFIVISWDPNADYLAHGIFADSTENIDDLEAKFVKWLSLPQWKNFEGKEVYLSVVLPSYDGALQEGWIEPAMGEDHWTVDWKEQAIGYEALFRALYNNDFAIHGVTSYGYWWSDQIYPVAKDLRNDLMHSIRQKDAEHVFYKWTQIFE